MIPVWQIIQRKGRRKPMTAVSSQVPCLYRKAGKTLGCFSKRETEAWNDVMVKDNAQQKPTDKARHREWLIHDSVIEVTLFP